MRTIKPGQLAKKGPERKKKGSSSSADSPASKREVWDDFEATTKAKSRKEYQPGAANRMVAKPAPQKSSKSGDEVVEYSEVLVKPREDYEEIEEQFAVKFSNKDLLQHALTHRSALSMKDRHDYERLEFLGDAVLDLSVAHLLSDRHPEAREGDLSKMRAALVNTQALAEIGKRIGLSAFIKLGRGEYSSGGAERPSILADVMEAIIGAIYRDSGFEVSMKMIEKLFGDELDKVTPFDPKTELQEALHVAGSEPPSYLLEMVEGPEHSPTFVTVVMVDNEVAGRGKGPTKKASQQAAAAEALSRLESDENPIELQEGQSEIITNALLTSSSSPDELEDIEDAEGVEEVAGEIEE